MIEEKFDNLKDILRSMESVLLAYSGGVDSTFLLKVAFDILKEKVIAITAVSATYSEEELKFAKKMAQDLGVRHIIISTDELKNDNFVRNAPDRCYWCKRELFSRLKALAQELGFKSVIDGSNHDDSFDYRPGAKAAEEYGVRSPLREAKLTKQDIRLLSRRLGLPTWDKPSLACLSSRFPYGVRIEEQNIWKVDHAERFLRSLGFRQVRVRFHNDIARIEVFPEEIGRLVQNDVRKAVVEELKKIGFIYITIDIEGYRSGSMNEVLKKEECLT